MAGERLDVCHVGPLGLLGDRGWALKDEVAGDISGAKRWPRLLECAARYLAVPEPGVVPPIEITLPGGVKLHSGDPEVNELLSQFIGHRVSLWPLLPPSERAHYRRAIPGAWLMRWLATTRTRRRLLQRLMSLMGADRKLRTELGRLENEPMPDMSVLSAELFEYSSPLGSYVDLYPVHLLTTASLEEMARAYPGGIWDVRRFRPNFLVETESGMAGLVESDWAGRRLRIGSVELAGEIPTFRCSMPMRAQAELPADPEILRSIVSHGGQNLGLYLSVAKAGTVRPGDAVEIV